MLKLEENDYDLNFLCSFSFDFQMLKDVLIKLAKSNQNLEEKIQNLENSINEKNKRLSTLEKKFKLYMPEENDNSESELSFENEENNIEAKNIYNEESKKKAKPIKEKEEKKVIDKEQNYNNKETNPLHRVVRIKSLKEIKLINSLSQQPYVSPEVIKSLLKLINENSEKISKLEKNVNQKLDDNFKNLENDFENLTEENSKEHKLINKKLSDINEKLYDYNDKMDGIIVKTSALDTLSIFVDNGNGNLDSTKAMIKVLEEKVNKRMELLEAKSNKDNKEDIILKSKVEELEELLNKLNGKIKNREQKINNKNNNNNSNNNMENIINNYNEDISELKKLIDKNYNEFIKIKEQLSSKIENLGIISEQCKSSLDKIKSEIEIKTPKLESTNTKNNDNKDNNNTSGKNNLKVEGIKKDDNIFDNNSNLKEGIKALNNKINDIDNYYKSLFDNANQDNIEIKKRIEELNSNLNKKITKLDLKDLENKIIEQSDEIVFLQDKVSEVIEVNKKLSEKNVSLTNRIEYLTNDILKLKNREIKVIEPKTVDLSPFVEKKALNEILKPISSSLEDLILTKIQLLNHIKEINEKLAPFETKKRVKNLEEEINKKIDDLEKEVSKNYVEKAEMNKIIKKLEIKIKLINTPKNKDGDSWLLAKQSLGCFNCASCESNIKNLSPQNEYSIWNKYPQSEIQFHMGQGFSKILQKITSYKEKNKNNKKDLYSDMEFCNNSYFNKIPSIKGIHQHFFFKKSSKENKIDKSFRNKKKYNLPIVSPKMKDEKIPLTDDEDNINNITVNNSDDKTNDNKNNSPKIIKIFKKKIGADLVSIKVHHRRFNEQSSNLLNSTSIKSNSKLEVSRSMPLFENISNN